MKKPHLKALVKSVAREIKNSPSLKEIIKLQESLNEMGGDADDSLKKAKKIVIDKLKNNKDLSQPESELAISSTDKSEKPKIAQSISKNNPEIKENQEEEMQGSGKNLAVSREIKTKTGLVIKAGTAVNIMFSKNKNSVCFIDLKSIGLQSDKKYLRIPISIMYKFFPGCKKAPSMKTLEKQSNDGVCTTVFGSRVEPDGYDQFGAPSWLLVFGVI